jgi:hypothetical protein
LKTALFAAKPADFAYWILLDFLGFSRQNRDFSMGYVGFSLDEFSRASVALEAPRWAGLRDHVEKRRIVHGANLSCFLIFCKELSPEPFLFGRLNPIATRARAPFFAGASRCAKPAKNPAI